MLHRVSIAAVAVLAVRSAGAAEPYLHAAAMQRGDSGSYYVQVGFGDGVQTRLLVDTGSGYVALSHATFARVRRLPGVEYLRDIAARMANGRRLTVPVYRVPRLRLGESCLMTDVEVTVMPGARRDILGLSALRKVAPFAMQLTPPVLYVSRCEPAAARPPQDT